MSFQFSSSRLRFFYFASAIALAGVCAAETTPGVAAPENPPKVDSTSTTKATTTASETLEQLIARNREQNLRDFLSSRGIKDEATQKILVVYIARQEQSRHDLKQLGNKLFTALAAVAPTDSAEPQIKKLVDDYGKALEEFSKSQQEQKLELEKQLKVSQNFRIQAVLMVLGVAPNSEPLVPTWGVPGTIQ
jgi:hypothetical protein